MIFREFACNRQDRGDVPEVRMCVGVDEGRCTRIVILAGTGICRCDDTARWFRTQGSTDNECPGLQVASMSGNGWSPGRTSKKRGAHKRKVTRQRVGHGCPKMHATNGENLGCSCLVSPKPGEGYLYDGSEVETIYTTHRVEKEMGERERS